MTENGNGKKEVFSLNLRIDGLEVASCVTVENGDAVQIVTVIDATVIPGEEIAEVMEAMSSTVVALTRDTVNGTTESVSTLHLNKEGDEPEFPF